MRTHAGASPSVNEGEVVFSTIGFMGLYLVVGLLFLYLVARELHHGPRPAAGEA